MLFINIHESYVHENPGRHCGHMPEGNILVPKSEMVPFFCLKFLLDTCQPFAGVKGQHSLGDWDMQGCARFAQIELSARYC